MTPIERIVNETDSCFGLKVYKAKIMDKLRQNVLPFVEALSEDSVITFASDLLQDYHDYKNNGHLWADNRDVDDSDIEDFSKIVISILVYYDWLPIYAKADDEIRRISSLLRKELQAATNEEPDDEDKML